MLSEILIFADLVSAVRMPRVMITLNGVAVDHSTQIIESNDFTWSVVWKISGLLDNHNRLQVSMHDKIDQDNRIVSGKLIHHTITIKQIRIDDIDADWLLFERSVFRHNMPETWIKNMSEQGYHIQPEYNPGTDININGSMTFDFKNPFWIDLITSLHNIST